MDGNRRKGFAYISLAHLMVDSVPLYFPLYIVLADLDIATAGLISTVAKLISNGAQPFFGYWADRLRGKSLIVASILVGPLFFALIGLTRDYRLLAVMVAAGSIGISLFHPVASSVAHSLGGRRRHTAFSVFILAGTVGFASGQYVFSGVTRLFGTGYSWLLALPALAFAGLYAVNGPGMAPVRQRPGISGFLRLARANLVPLVILYLTVVIRGGVQMGFNFALPTLLKASGYAAFIYSGFGAIVFNMSGVLLLPVAGVLADRWGERWVLSLSMGLGVPCLLFFLADGGSHPAAALTCLGIGGALLACSNPVGVVMGQRLTPGCEATTSSFLMGFGWCLGSITPLLIGVFAKQDGVFVPARLTQSLTALALVPLAAGAAALFLPGKHTDADEEVCHA